MNYFLKNFTYPFCNRLELSNPNYALHGESKKREGLKQYVKRGTDLLKVFCSVQESVPSVLKVELPGTLAFQLINVDGEGELIITED